MYNKRSYLSWKIKRYIASTIFNLFEKEDILISKMGEDNKEYISNFTNLCNDQNLNPEHRWKSFHNVLKDEAKRLYVNTDNPNLSNFSEAGNVIRKEYNLDTRKKQLQNFVLPFHVSTILQEQQ